MQLSSWPLYRLVLVWVVCIVAALLLMLSGTVLDASGERPAGLLAFFMASICIAAPLILTWHWRQYRK